MHILLLDDDYDLTEMYAASLRQNGHQVIEADSAQSALDALESYAVEVIIMEMLLPYHNGISFLHELRSFIDWSDLPVIVASNIPAAHMGLTKSHLNKFGIINYLDKSVLTPATLLAVIEKSVAKPA
jgi:DNA-binding response OmpR family regulator